MRTQILPVGAALASLGVVVEQCCRIARQFALESPIVELGRGITSYARRGLARILGKAVDAAKGAAFTPLCRIRIGLVGRTLTASARFEIVRHP